MEQEVATQVVGLGGSTDFSIIQLFLRADFVVKSVIIILIAASIYSWALIFEKQRLFKKIEKSTSNFEEKFWKSKSAENFYNNLSNKEKDPLANVFQTAMFEVLRTKLTIITISKTFNKLSSFISPGKEEPIIIVSICS